MECQHAAEILSAVRDGAGIAPGLVVQARAHSRSCETCSALEAVADRVAAVPRPSAPAGLVDRIIARVEAEASASAVALPVEPATVPASAVPVFARRGRISRLADWWQPRFTLYASAAAAVLFLGLSSLLVARMGMQTASIDDQVPQVIDLAASETESAEEYSGTGAPEAAVPETDAMRAQVPAPPYITYDGRVWALVGPASPDPSSLTTIGVTVSDLGETGTPAERTVLSSGGDARSIYITAAGGGIQRFALVTRSLGLADYALTTDTSITVFGVWPMLPSRFPAPESPDGSPTFSRQGFDDRNVDVYLPIGGNLTDGFAVAPGMPEDDPSAGNPNWTWWERAE